MKDVRVGIAPMGWIHDDLRGWGPAFSGTQVMAQMAEAGYAGTEMSRAFPQDPTAVRAFLAEYHLVLAGANRWTNLTHERLHDEEMRLAFKHIDFCREAGALVANVAEGGKSLHWDIRGPRPTVAPLTDDEWVRLVLGLNNLGGYASSVGMTLCMHPHGGTPIETEDEIDRLLALTDNDTVGYCLDTGHIAYGGGDPVRVIRKWKQRIRHIHAKDIRTEVLAQVRAGRQSFHEAVQMNLFCTPGAGSLDWEAIFAELSEYEGWLIVEAEQDPAVYHPFSVAQSARGFIRKVAGV